ncbi:hypothetical protein BDV93DRAFT_517510 [Ceratobasidium sp. AG-I]|nr:hypothetical protein BDV93DRAFT_517510 [Ceratobasidium sp. AG-I]
MIENGVGTAIFFLIPAIAVVLCLVFWISNANRRRRRLIMAANMPYPSISQPHPHARFGGDPVVRMEAGDNLDGLPKYSAQAQMNEQTVVRSVPADQPGSPRAGLRPDWVSRPSVFRQVSQTPSRPPPAYDPSAPRQP